MTRVLIFIAGVVIAVASAGCQFSPTAPFAGFDNKGTRIVGQFRSEGAAMLGATLSNAAVAGVQGIVVTMHERPELRATVSQNGGFTLSGVPSGSFTLVFLRDGRNIGEIRVKYVRKNQGITLTLVLTSTDEVVLVKEQRDQVTFAGECPRGAGFWCQNQRGQNPNLSKEDFETFAEEAAKLLAGINAFENWQEVAAEVCNTRDQFLRQLAALALNLAAGTVTPTTNLQGEQDYTTVGAAFDKAVAYLKGQAPLTSSERETLKDVMDRINNAQNIAGCDQLPDEDETELPEEQTPPSTETPSSGAITICHIPPGNYNARQTLTIDASAWPAHQGHCAQGKCDSMGGCN